MTGSDDVTTLRLPLSGLIYQRRNDGRWRCLNPDQYDDEQAGRFHSHPDEWVPADLRVGIGGRAERSDGSRAKEDSWWLVYGDNRCGPVDVTLADGRKPPVITFGPLWICEWLSGRQEAFVSVGKESHTLFDRIPHYIQPQHQKD